MVRTTRVVLAAVLTVAVAALPLMLDQCSATCEAHHDSVASTPACHHTGTAAVLLVGHAPSPCGHDHNGTLVTADNGLTTTSRPLVASVAIVAIPVNSAIAIKRYVHNHAPPGTASTVLDRSSLPLRI
jgi:hypothetical protein